AVPGHQITISEGRIYFVVKPISVGGTAYVEVCIYDDEYRSHELICRNFEFEVKTLPMAGSAFLALICVVIGLLLLTDKKEKVKRGQNVF
ncbi:MAG: hypothetical protein ACP5QY_07035, partial [Candidatus Hydrogenedens sp.]